jgi:nicotinamide-nucleotide amidase
MSQALARAVVARLVEMDRTVASAESLTGGLVVAALTDVPGSSAVVRGGVVAYVHEVKASVLGVDRELLSVAGAVDARVAEQMAAGVRGRLGATYGLATTGVAGPGPSDGKPVGTVFVALAGPGTSRVQALALTGTRAEIRAASVEAVLTLLAEAMDLAVPGSEGREDEACRDR